MSPKLKKALKITGIVVGAFVMLIVIAVLIVDTEFEVERTVVIEQPVDSVFGYITYLRNQENFSTWAEIDPQMQTEYRGTDGTVGFVSAWWGSDEVGSGEQEIVGITEGERIDYELRFFEPFESTSRSFMSTEPVSDNQTRVTWGMSGSSPRPFNLVMLFIDLEEALGSDFEEGLENLKVLLEKSGMEL